MHRLDVQTFFEEGDHWPFVDLTSIVNLFLCLFCYEGCARWAAAVTQNAPHFKGTAVHKGDFKEISLDDYKGKYLVLFFYPLDL